MTLNQQTTMACQYARNLASSDSDLQKSGLSLRYAALNQPGKENKIVFAHFDASHSPE